MRGNPAAQAVAGGGTGSIPAYAGEPRRSLWGGSTDGVYPRVCGGTVGSDGSFIHSGGLSPRMRGNLKLLIRPGCPWRSIPAYAGEPRRGVNHVRHLGVYPRVCGGTPRRMTTARTPSGLSPRMRGNPRWSPAIRRPRWSIPAYAGEPQAGGGAYSRCGVYPRVCGGTGSPATDPRNQTGLSPRMRGNLVARGGGPVSTRSIPAYAGEPITHCTHIQSKRVYPRVCGGTIEPAIANEHRAGLSPRMRGNQLLTAKRRMIYRSIPAYAGEPRTGIRSPECEKVYPRVCGGTPDDSNWKDVFDGLSPRMRGNPSRPSRNWASKGSIPAYAGEPIVSVLKDLIQLVYPRVCGGTRPTSSVPLPGRGLSPRMRGNRIEDSQPPRQRGSIPAYAGEPPHPPILAYRIKVYPRVCGGTWQRQRPRLVRPGLSPRMRGNQRFDGGGCGGHVSIPAYAGEPAYRPVHRRALRVYPRVCGGTPPAHPASWNPVVYPRVCGGTTRPHPPHPGIRGLSPRMRGNLAMGLGLLVNVRSIPAYAGEPN